MKHTIQTIIAVSAAAFGLTACGGDAGPPGAPATVTITTPPASAPRLPTIIATPPSHSDHTQVEHQHEGQGQAD